MVFNQNILTRRILTDNVWWQSGQIPFYGEYSKRRYYEGFYSLLKQKALHRALVLMGPRRVGKTVMMYQAIQDLLDEGVEPTKVLYFSLDTPIYTNESLESLIGYATALEEQDIEGCYVFFDEIQYLKNWEIHLKALVDKNRNTKFIASGSAAAALKMKSVESGAGRFSDFFPSTLNIL